MACLFQWLGEHESARKRGHKTHRMDEAGTSASQAEAPPPSSQLACGQTGRDDADARARWELWMWWQSLVPRAGGWRGTIRFGRFERGASRACDGMVVRCVLMCTSVVVRWMRWDEASRGATCDFEQISKRGRSRTNDPGSALALGIFVLRLCARSDMDLVGGVVVVSRSRLGRGRRMESKWKAQKSPQRFNIESIELHRGSGAVYGDWGRTICEKHCYSQYLSFATRATP